MTLYSAAITLLLVMDPIGNIPVFISLLKNVKAKRRTWIILRESLIAFVILAVFVFAGKPILLSFGLSNEALSISGGIILFLIALKMIFPLRQKDQDIPEGEPLIVPMAVPLIAGPSALATVLLLTTKSDISLWFVFMAVLIAAIGSTLILLLSQPLSRVLGRPGLLALERLMGMILTVIAVQMFLTGLAAFLR
jgi:multiple antibiotic resistance protein